MIHSLDIDLLINVHNRMNYSYYATVDEERSNRRYGYARGTPYILSRHTLLSLRDSDL